MSKAICSVPIAVPVFRMRATVACRDLGTPAHRAVERLLDLDATVDTIAGLLGLSLRQVENLLGQLDGTRGRACASCSCGSISRTAPC